MNDEGLLGKAHEISTRGKEKRERALQSIAPRHHGYIVEIESNQKIGTQARINAAEAEEARQLGGNFSESGGMPTLWMKIKTQYLSVEGRIAILHEEAREQGWSIRMNSEIILQEGIPAHTRAWIKVSKGDWSEEATGVAKIGAELSGVDKTNPLENSETSAYGRALGFLAYGLLGSGIASAEEVEGARAEDDAAKKGGVKEVKTTPTLPGTQTPPTPAAGPGPAPATPPTGRETIAVTSDLELLGDIAGGPAIGSDLAGLDPARFQNRFMALLADHRTSRGVEREKYERCARTVLYGMLRVKSLRTLTPDQWRELGKPEMVKLVRESIDALLVMRQVPEEAAPTALPWEKSETKVP
ncbi:MAG: hypothetical protein WCK89_13085 [bacterium]